ncbi:ABC transporter substrate-binding protein [Desertimonas flava]|uniref:ABC transporter substrate-binding protein n=1 Tax=Desertimonas flava TaxID=2064846 RepID=UPI000E3558A9|nr:ABC transporter substrate-binding protein [Desertimonas flava]
MTHRTVVRSLTRGRPILRRGAAVLAAASITGAIAGGVASATTEPPAGSEPAATAEPQRGGKAVVVFSGQPASLDPQLQRVSFCFAECSASSAVFASLAYMNPISGEVELYFLESLEPNEDASVWTMRLHPSIKFSDGTPLDAEAIKFNIERAADPETGSRFQPATEGLELEVIDELTLEVTLPGPDPSWDADLVSNFAGVGSPTAIQAAIDEGVEVGSRPVGAGPFMVADWDPGQRLVLERNPYFEDFKPGQPYLDEITMENVADRSQMTTALTSGAAQIVLTSGGGATDELVEAANAVVTMTGGGAAITLNTAIPPFDDVRARLALALALDRDLTSEAFAPGTPPSAGLFPETSPFHNPEYTWPEQDVAEAQRLFDELAAEGKPVDFSYTTYANAEQTNVVNTLIAQLAEFDNVTFEADIKTYSEYVAAMPAGEFQSVPSGTYFTGPLPILYDYVAPDGVLNYGRWENAEVGAAFADLPTASTLDEQKAIWDVLQRELVEEMPFVWLGVGVVSVGYADGMIVPRTINYGTFPLWAEIGYE